MRKIIILTLSIICLTVLGFWVYNMKLYSEEIVEGVILKEPKFNGVIPKAVIDSLVQSENIKNSTEIITPEEECIFDLKTQTDEFLKKIPEFSNYVWSKKDKKATIKLNDGRKLIVTRGGCDHFSFYGNLILDRSQLNLKNEDEIFKLSLWVAEKLFHKSDYELMKEQLLKTKNYKLEKTIDQYYLTFTQDNYCDMTLVADNLNDNNLISVEIGYYIC